MPSQTSEPTRRPSNLSRKALDVAKRQAKLSRKTMAVWVGLAILEKADREEKDPSAVSKTSLTEEMLQPLGRPPNLANDVLQIAKIRSAIAGKTMAVWLSEAMFEKAARDTQGEGSKTVSKKLVHA